MINHSLRNQDMPRVEEAPIINFFDNSEKRIDADRVLNGSILLPVQPYEYDTMSPTPLDPFNLRTTGVDYYNAAEMLMDARLHEVALRHDIPETIQQDVMSETKFEHEHRSHKNADTMSRLRELAKNHGIESFDVHEANEIMRARAAVSRLGSLAMLLARYPEIGGIEVMKLTRPFDHVAMALAEAAFIARLHRTKQTLGSDFDFELTPGEKPRPINTHEQVSPTIMPSKVKQVDLEVYGVPLEIVSRPSYLAVDPCIDLPGVRPRLKTLGSIEANMQDISVTKYIRVAKR